MNGSGRGRQSKMEAVTYKGRELYRLQRSNDSSTLVPSMTESEFEEFLLGLPFPEIAKLRIRGCVAILAEYYGIADMGDYAGDGEIKAYIVDNSVRSSRELFQKHNAVWKLAHARNITVHKVWEEARQSPDLDSIAEDSQDLATPEAPAISLKGLSGRGTARKEFDFDLMKT